MRTNGLQTGPYQPRLLAANRRTTRIAEDPGAPGLLSSGMNRHMLRRSTRQTRMTLNSENIGTVVNVQAMPHLFANWWECDSVRMATTKVFFSHATEDKGRVLAVYERLVARYPDLEPWVDTFEITGGQALLDRIAAGMDEAEKFFVFLSPVSIEKPWVQAEFRRALTQELSGQRPEYVVPVKMGGLTKVPAFMETKKYINLDALTEAEWLGEFYAAASGAGLSKEFAVEPNLIIDGATFASEPHVAQFRIQVRHWAEETSFKAITRTPGRGGEWMVRGWRPSGWWRHRGAANPDRGRVRRKGAAVDARGDLCTRRAVP